MGHQEAPAVAADQPAPAGQVAFQPLADEGIDGVVEQGKEVRYDGMLVGPATTVVRQVFAKDCVND